MTGTPMRYQIIKNFFGQKHITFGCEKCGTQLDAPLTDAGMDQQCPVCHHHYICPGIQELEQEKAEQLAEENKKRQFELAKRQAAITVQVKAVSPPPPPEPELKWYGKMRCGSCGYIWQSRRNTPPARCPRCSTTNIYVVRQAAGCMVFVAIMLAGTVAAMVYLKG
jgi:rubrerythrin